MALVESLFKERIGYITLNRPEKRNALNPAMVTELKQAFDQAQADVDVKVIVLRANGDAFCAGADLAYLQELQKYSYEENLSDSLQLKDLLLQIYSSRKVVIGQVHGPALAGGCGLITVCDFVFAAHEAKFGYTEVKIGFVPAIVMVFLLRKIGEARTRDLLLTGKLINAEAAREAGIVSRVVAKDYLDSEVHGFAEQVITTASAQSLAVTKEMITGIQHLSLEEALNYAARQNARARGTDDCKRGIEGFLQKMPVKW